MSEKKSLTQRWDELQPSKTALFWSSVGSVVVVLVLGFTWGGWVTGGTATEMAEDAAADARAEVTAVYCTERFLAAPDVRVQLAALKDLSSYRRRSFVGETGFATPPGAEGPDRNAAALCAQRLVDMEVDLEEAAAEDAGSTVQ